MKKIIATRMYNFNYFHTFFFDYYSNQGFDDMLIFSRAEDIACIKSSVKNDRVKFLELPKHQVPLIYNEERGICNWIFQKSLDFYGAKYSDQEAVILYADDDEYYPEVEPESTISRFVFFEWYLPETFEKDTEAAEFYQLVQSAKCKGRLLTIWNDPFYKESLIKVSRQNLAFLKSCIYTNAFHRICHNNNILNEEKKYFFTDHLKGIPFRMAKERITEKYKNLSDKNDWCSNHYILEYKNYCDYTKFYENLHTSTLLKDLTTDSLNAFNQKDSFYENSVLPLDWVEPTLNTPSRFFNKDLI